MELRVLGPVEAWDGSCVAPLGGARQRRVLAALLASPNLIVPVDRLIDVVWGDDAPQSALNTLQTYVSRLRSVIGGARSGEATPAIESQSGGYLLRCGDHDLDSRRFEALLTSGRRARDDGDPVQAQALLGSALALWRGPAFGEFASEPFAMAVATRLEELRMEAVEERLGAWVLLGRFGDVIAEAETCCAGSPFRERLWSARMQALYGAGRQADALRAATQLREMLVEELGVEPGAEIRDLESAILRHEPWTGWPQPARPVAAGAAPAAADGALGTGAGTRPVADRVPLPPMIRHLGSGPFVGRTQARTRVAESISRPAGRSVVMVTGEAGIGKTRLAAEVGRAEHEAGAVVAYGRCSEQALVSYEPFVEALRFVIDRMPIDLLAAAVDTIPAELDTLLPEIGQRLVDVPAATAVGDPDRLRLFEAIDRILEVAAGRGHVLLVLDDLHWADGSTLALLRHLVREPVADGLRIVGCYRDTDVGRHHPLLDALADMSRVAPVETVDLAGLDPAEIATIADAIGGSRIGSAVAAHAGGNPFFAAELTRHLMSGDGDPGVDVPDGAAAVIRRRVARLSDGAEEVLRIAAVCGLDFDVSVVEHAVGWDGDRVMAALEEALDARLLAEPPGMIDRLEFVHPLVRQTLYSDVSGAMQARLHRRVAGSIEIVRGDDPASVADQLAHHYRCAAPLGTAGAAARWTAVAAAQALAVGAFESACTQVTATLDLLGAGADDRAVAELETLRGEALWAIGNYDDAKVAFRAASHAAERAGEPEAMARAVLGLGGSVAAFDAVIIDADLVELLRRVLEALPPDDSAVRARVMARLAEAIAFEPGMATERDELCEAALAMSRRVGDPATLAYVLVRRRWAAGLPVELDSRLAVTGELESIADSCDDGSLAVEVRISFLEDVLEIGDRATFDRRIDEAVERAIRLGQPYHRWETEIALGMRALLDGDLDAAERLAEAALATGHAAENANAFGLYAAHLFVLRREQGRIAELLEFLDDVIGDEPPVSAWGHAAIWIRVQAGAPEGAARDLAAITAGGCALIPPGPFELTSLVLLTDVAAAVGDPVAGEALRARLAPHAGRWVNVGGAVSLGSTWRPLGELTRLAGDLDGAVSHLEAAVAAHQAVGAVPFDLRSRVELAGVLLERGRSGDVARARELLDHAVTQARSFGLVDLARQAEALVGDAGHALM